MTPILGYIRLLLGEDLGPLTPLQRKVLDSVASCTDRLRALIDNLLDVTAIETGQIRFHERDYEFSAAARRSVDLCTKQLGEKRIALELEIPEQLGTVRGDPDKVARAMAALVDNAAKFSPAGGRVQVAARARNVEYEFSVTDSGDGIDPLIVDRVFEPFFQADGSATRTHQGAGLGLALVKRFVEAMGGRVGIESPPASGSLEPGHVGTCVWICVPRTPPQRPERA